MPRKKVQVASLVLTIFADALGFSLVVALFPPIILHDHLHMLSSGMSLYVRNLLLGVLIALYPLAQFISAPILGVWSDHVGRKKILQFTLLGSAVSYLLYALSFLFANLSLLFLARISAGLFAGNATLAQAGLGDLSTEKTRTRNFTFVVTAGGLAFIIGPFLGGRLSDASLVSWFTINTPFYAASLLFAFVFILFSVVFNDTQMVQRHPKEKTKWSKVLFSSRDHHSSRLGLPLFSFFVIRMGFWLAVFFYGAYLIERFGLSKVAVANAYMALAISSLITTNTAVVWLKSRLAIKTLVLVTASASALSFFMIVLQSHPNHLYWILPLWTFGGGGFYTYMLSYLSDAAGKEHQGAVMGASMSCQSLGQVVAPLIGGCVMTAHHSMPIVLGGLMICVGVLVLALGWFREKQSS